MNSQPFVVRVQQEALDITLHSQPLYQLGAGAVVCFSGQVRSADDSSGIARLSLEHYPDMTENSMRQIMSEARQRWPLLGGCMIHRVGDMQPGDLIVLAAAASSHRHDAFHACEFLMDYLKTRVPIWKRETTTAGQSRWVAHRDSDRRAAARWFTASHDTEHHNNY